MRVGITAAVGAVFALSFALPAEAASIGEKTAQKQGMATMLQDGLLKVLRGETTLEEINRVTTD